MKFAEIIPHLLIRSMEVVFFSVISILTFLHFKVLDIINSIRYYEEDIYVKLFILLAFVISIVFIFIIKLYQNNKIMLESTIIACLITLIIFSILCYLIHIRLIDTHGTEYFLVNFVPYFIGTILYFGSIIPIHHFIDNKYERYIGKK